MEILEITDLTVEGFGVAKQSGLVYFVKGIVAPGDVVRAVVTSQRKNYAEAELVELVQASPYRIEPLCPHFSQCGGCQLVSLVERILPLTAQLLRPMNKRSLSPNKTALTLLGEPNLTVLKTN